MQNEQVKAIEARQFDKASGLMPSKIDQTFEQPKVSEMILAIGQTKVSLQIEFELIKLAELMSVGGNLNQAQVTFIAGQLIELFPKESISDFKICFQRGAIGSYGDIQRMDGITIRKWMEKYLEEKYQVLEDRLMKEKEDHYKIVIPENSDRDWLKEWEDAIKSVDAKPVLQLTPEEIEEQGQEKPKREVYKFNETEAEIKSREVHEKIFAGQEISIRERYQDLTEEQIQQKIKELREYTIAQERKPKHLSCTDSIWNPKPKWSRSRK